MTRLMTTSSRYPRYGALSILDWTQLAMWIALLIAVAVLVGLARCLRRNSRVASDDMGPRLVDDDSDLGPLADVVRMLA